MRVVEGFVPGHSWGRFLDVFLDTWPVTGGESCREMIAKGRPVVTMHSAEMPAIDLQRDPTLVVSTWRDYAETAIHLLRDPQEYAAASTRAAALAQAMTDQAAFEVRLIGDLESILMAKRSRPTEPVQRWIPAAISWLWNRNATK
jgi:predicted O-linked N-acetylglucosamine transferase (SPINDLY family)